VNEKAHAIITVSLEDPADTSLTLDAFLKAGLTDLKKTYGDLTASKPQSGRVKKQDCLRCEVKFTFNGDRAGGVVSATKVGPHYVLYLGFASLDRLSAIKSALASLSEEITEVVVPVGPDITVKGKDGLFQLTLTGDWKQQPLPINSPVAYQLFVENFQKHAVLEVFTLVRADVTQDLQQTFDGNVAGLSKSLTDATHTDTETLKLAGFDALRCELTGGIKDKDVKLTYLITAIQTPTQLMIIDESCTEKEYARLKPILLKPLGSLKELTVTAKADPDAAPPVLGRLTAIKNKDGTVQIGLPHGWKANPLAPDAGKSMQISASCMQDGADLQVLVDDHKDVTLKQYTEATLAAFGNDPGISDPTHTDPQTIKINNKDAAQFEMHCTSGGTKLGYLVTITQTDKSFLRSQFSTTESKFAKMKPIFIQLAQGLKQGAVDDNSDDQ
jgi:hypothetical protein